MDLDRMNSELERKQQELASMTHHVKKDIPWRPGVQDQMNSEYVEWDEYSDPNEASRLQREIAELKKQINEEPERKRREEEAKMAREQRKYSSTIDKIKNGAKVRYDEIMNEYMSKNFFGKAKAILTGKKPKKMNRKEIMENFGQNSMEEQLEMALQIEERKYQENIAWVKTYYTEHPEDLDPSSPTHDSIEHIIEEETKLHKVHMIMIREKYEKYLEHATTSAKDWGFSL